VERSLRWRHGGQPSLLLATDGQGELRPGAGLTGQSQACQLHQERERGFRLLVGVLDVEPVILVLHRHMCARRPLTPLGPAHVEKATHDNPPVELMTGRVEGNRRQPTGGVLRRNVNASGDVVQRLQQRARFQIEARDAFGRVGGREGIECRTGYGPA
jgi:hypothetical protein